jgi:predicted O-methyltransferase YrrM
LSNRFYDAGPDASGQKVMLATTVYDKPDASYVYSIARSREALSAAGIQSAYYLLQGNCHVDDARNAVVRDFLRSDCTDLVFLDGDVSWPPESLVALCLCDRDLVGGIYPYRRENELEESMPVRMLTGVNDIDADGLLEVEGLPTGFMKIKRHVLETMAATSRHFIKDDGLPHPVVFERDYYGGGRRGGDIRFCMVWREMGGKVWAMPELRLGHCGSMVLRDSLGASIRRRNNTWLQWMVKAIREGSDDLETYVEAFKAAGNKWGAQADVLQLAAGLARASALPILEAGSGLTTVIMAAANPARKVWSIEHDPHYAGGTESMAALAGVGNIAIVTAELKDRWYDLADVSGDLPAEFGVGLLDGPPRGLSNRMRFLEEFGDRCRVILCDDANDTVYGPQIRAWAASRGRTVQSDGRAAVILPK